MNRDRIHEFEGIIDYKFNNIKVLENSLTHSSYSNEDKAYNKINNERLEFLGDAVLSISVSRFIYDEFPDYPEGELTKLRARVVCEDTLSLVAENLNIGKYLLLGKGEEASGGRESIINIKLITPKAPRRESDIISKTLSSPLPDNKPSAVSAAPSKCMPPVTAR
jgi:dsRNA-specific ribonuclease